KVVERGEEAVAVVVVDEAAGIDAGRPGPYQRVRGDEGAGIVLAAVDPVGVGGERADPRGAVETEGEAGEELGIAAAAALAAHRDRGLAAREEHRRRRGRMAVARDREGDPGERLADVAGLSLQRIAEDDRGDARAPGDVGGGEQAR